MASARTCFLTALALYIAAGRSPAAPPTCTTHFFDWYVIGDAESLEAKQKQWTYRLDWGALGIVPQEIGTSVHYYEVQCRKIREAEFDGIHYEWHGNPLKPQFKEALEKTGLPVAMFYDMQIRFHGRPDFITPSDDFADECVRDIVSFYRPIPKSLWLLDRNGRLPIIIYGYAFDGGVTDPRRWHEFYRAIIDGVQKELGKPVVFHWTNNGSPQQMYGFQHFPEIQSYIFNEASGQTLVNARSVTFVVHYDDLGVSLARGGPRARRWIRNDIRYLQEALWLAKHTDPDLVFNYGWNELYEGEHLLPDSLWGSWRYDLAAAMVKDIKQSTQTDLPRVLVIADDFLPALHAAGAEQSKVLRREMSLLTRLRSLVPQAEVALPGKSKNLADYEIIFCLNTVKEAAEEEAISRCGRSVVYANPGMTANTPMTRTFTAKPRKNLARPDLGPPNEYVVVQRRVDVDLARFPVLEFRVRNTPGTVIHIRYSGLNAAGQEVQAWCESSPTDDRMTDGAWLEDEANVAEIAAKAAGEPIPRLTGIHVILDDLVENGRFGLDVDYLRFVGRAGEVGWKEDFEDIGDWTVHASFEGSPGAEQRFAFVAAREDGTRVGRMTLEAIVSEALSGPIDESTRRIEPLEDVRTLLAAEFHGTEVPILLARGKSYWLNTYAPTDDCWEALFAELTGEKLNRGVMFRSFSHAVHADGLNTDTNQSAMIIQEEPLPVDRIRLVAPPELKDPLRHSLPKVPGKMRLRVIQGDRQEIPFPDPGSDPPGVTLEPGEVVEITREQ